MSQQRPTMRTEVFSVPFPSAGEGIIHQRPGNGRGVCISPAAHGSLRNSSMFLEEPVPASASPLVHRKHHPLTVFPTMAFVVLRCCGAEKPLAKGKGQAPWSFASFAGDLREERGWFLPFPQDPIASSQPPATIYY